MSRFDVFKTSCISVFLGLPYGKKSFKNRLKSNKMILRDFDNDFSKISCEAIHKETFNVFD